MNFEGNLGVLNNTMFYNSNMMLNSLANTITVIRTTVYGTGI